MTNQDAIKFIAQQWNATIGYIGLYVGHLNGDYVGIGEYDKGIGINVRVSVSADERRFLENKIGRRPKYVLRLISYDPHSPEEAIRIFGMYAPYCMAWRPGL